MSIVTKEMVIDGLAAFDRWVSDTGFTGYVASPGAIREALEAVAPMLAKDAAQPDFGSIAAITDILDGKDTGEGVCNEPWQSLRMRLVELVRRNGEQAVAGGYDNESLDSQTARLAQFIIDEIPGEPSQSQGAVDTAIRWMRDASVNKTLPWAIEQWNKQVKDRPLSNIHRRVLDDVWRQVIRHEGGDDIALCGPAHDNLLAAKGNDHEN